MSWFVWQGADLILEIALQPGARCSEWSGLHGDRLKLRLQAPPVDGRANVALIEFLAESFHLPKSYVQIERGLASRQKRVRVRQPTYLPTALCELGLHAMV
jgi:uncharacterized protein